jgi:hypothetical protein
VPAWRKLKLSRIALLLLGELNGQRLTGIDAGSLDLMSIEHVLAWLTTKFTIELDNKPAAERSLTFGFDDSTNRAFRNLG